MKKRKVIWFCAAQFSDQKIKTTGTWLIAMGNALAKTEEIELYNVTYGDVKSITRKDAGNISQWIIPRKERVKYHRGSDKLISFIQKIDDEIKPDLIHVWGTEYGFGFAVIEAKLQTGILFDIQGLLFATVKYYYGGLSNRDLLKCIGLKEFLKPQFHPFFVRRRFKKQGRHELGLIRQMKNISVQSEWVHSIIKNVAPESNIFSTGIMLRSEFAEAPAWRSQDDNGEIRIFTTCSGPIPYKGIHVIFDAIALLKNRYPNIKLSIGGDIKMVKKYGLFRDGYTGWLLRKAKKLGIADSIYWMGMMNADEMTDEMCRSSMVVIPSYVETYCLFMAESMMTGVPLVASFSGAMPELAENGRSALFFPAGDQWSCARQIERIISDTDLANNLSAEARKVALLRNDPDKVLRTQLDIYQKMMPDEKILPADI
ncbi:MAG: glycosyltransferase [Fermentimonas sp.]|nr:glycosyltransferase [Fermentimonas sp.]